VKKHTYTHQSGMDRATVYKNGVIKFFNYKDHFSRLEKIVHDASGPQVFPMILYFVTKYPNHRLCLTPSGDIYYLHTAYCDALRSHQKRMYDFESKTGRGDLMIDGRRNPNILVNEHQGSTLALPLPKLVALKWFIENGFDYHFWKHYDDVSSHFFAHIQEKKKMYSDAHKNKKKRLREEMEQRVLRERGGTIVPLAPSLGPTPMGKARLSRTERKRVVALINEETKKRQKNIRLARHGTKRREHNHKPKSSCMLNTENNEGVPLSVNF